MPAAAAHSRLAGSARFLALRARHSLAHRRRWLDKSCQRPMAGPGARCGGDGRCAVRCVARPPKIRCTAQPYPQSTLGRPDDDKTKRCESWLEVCIMYVRIHANFDRHPKSFLGGESIRIEEQAKTVICLSTLVDGVAASRSASRGPELATGRAESRGALLSKSRNTTNGPVSRPVSWRRVVVHVGHWVFPFPTKLSRVGCSPRRREFFSVENFRYRQRSVIMVGLKRDSIHLYLTREHRSDRPGPSFLVQDSQ